MNFSTRWRAVMGLAPVADGLAGTAYSDIVKCEGGRVAFVLIRGVGTTGTSVITVEACDDNSPSNSEAIEFDYKQIDADDLEGAFTHCASTGYTTTAGSSRIDIIEVDPARLGELGYEYCRLKCVEDEDDPVLAGILVLVQKHNRGMDELPSLLS